MKNIRFYQNGQKSNQNHAGGRGNGRGNGKGRGRGGGGRGGRAPAAAKATPAATTTSTQNGDPCESIFDCYDLSKIPAKVAHFGQITPKMHDMLQAQLIQRDIEMKPVEKK